MTIKVGDTLPSMKLMVATAEGPKEISTDEIFKGKKVVLFAVPGAFTPTCSAKHFPGFVQNADALRAKGVDTIACIAVNDVFVMGAWGRSLHADGIIMLADHVAAFTQAMGLTMDATDFGLGVRSQRYAAVIQDGVIQSIEVEGSPVDHDVSSADAVLTRL
jgi:peroxiredoxin